MSRDLEAELDLLKAEIKEIKELLSNGGTSKEEAGFVQEEISGNVRKIRSNKISPEAKAKIDELKEFARKTGNEQGVVSYHGFCSVGTDAGIREASWGNTNCSIKELLNMTQSKVSTVLSALGNEQRLAILLALLEKPMSVAQLVEKLKMNTNGQAYHHLKGLLAADLIEEDKKAEKGTYAVKGHRVQGIIMILAGVNDLIDSTYSSGSWEE